MERTGLTPQQYDQLLKPLSPARVATRSQAGRSLAYLEAWDVKAHLIRIFGFGGWSADVIESELAFEEKNEKGQWAVGYRVVLRLFVHQLGCSYTEAAVGSANLPQRGEAHDMAIKTAESDALKRAAINLGTQFGLSLYDNGNKKDVIGHTLNAPDGFESVVVADAVKEVERLDATYALETIAEIQGITDLVALKELYEMLKEANTLEIDFNDNGERLLDFILERKRDLEGEK